MSGVELALAIVPLVIAVIQNRKPLARMGRAVITSRRSTEQRIELWEFYSQLYLESSMLNHTLQRLLGDAPPRDSEAIQQQVRKALGDGVSVSVFDAQLHLILQSFDDIISTKSLGLQGQDLDRSELARLAIIRNATNSPESKQNMRERLRLTRNVKSQTVALKKIKAGNDRLFMLINPPMELETYRSRKAEQTDMSMRPTAKGRRTFEPLYRRLARKWLRSCCNQFEHEARLALSSCCNSMSESGDGINVLVSLPGESDTRPDWQRLRMAALHDKAVRFKGDNEIPTTNVKMGRKDVDSDSICTLLQGALSKNTDVCIALEKDRLYQLKSEAVDWKITAQSGTTLEEFLAERVDSWGERDRSRLAVLLAHAVLHYMDSPWLCNNQWGKENVVFFRKSLSTEYELDQPFLKIEFQVDENTDPAAFNPDRIHGNPTILALGILLLEILSQKALESQRSQQHLSAGGEPNVNTDLTTALDFLKELKRKGNVREKYCKAVQACLDWKYDPSDDNEMREMIYREIVGPLETEFVEGFGTKNAFWTYVADTVIN